jgi:cytochrome c oxidase cbb3-type subunit 3
MKKLIIYLMFFFFLMAGGNLTFASEATTELSLADKIHETDGSIFVVLILGTLIIVCLLLTLVLLVVAFSSMQNAILRAKGLPEIDWVLFFKKKFVTGDILPVERSEEIKLTHNYDGIVELDNTMPPWLRAVFGITIAVAISYLGFYYVLEMGAFQEEEYETEMAYAQVEKDAYQKKMALSINDDNVTQIKDAKTLALAQEVFSKNCKTCHGAQAEGGAGPNLTDAYWLHGGDIKSIFKTIKYGVPAKGMIAWQQKLTPKDIQDLGSYILSLQGSNPAGAKAPQGQLEGAAAVVSTAKTTEVATDSSQQKAL